MVTVLVVVMKIEGLKKKYQKRRLRGSRQDILFLSCRLIFAHSLKGLNEGLPCNEYGGVKSYGTV